MTRRDEIASQHEPFGDAFYFGPECMSPRFKDDPARRAASGVSDATYKSTLDGFEEVSKQVRFFPSAGFDSFFFLSHLVVAEISSRQDKKNSV